MDLVKRIGKNISVLTVSNILTKAVGFFFFLLVARHLGAEGYGILSTAIAFGGLFRILTDLGFRKLTVREVAKNKDRTEKYLSNVFTFKILLFGLFFIVIAGVANFLGYSTTVLNVIYILGLNFGLMSFNQAFYSIYQAHEKMEYFALGKILTPSIKLIGAFSLLSLGYGVFAIAFLYVVSSLILLFYNILCSRSRFELPSLELDLPFLKREIKRALPFGALAVFIKIYYDIDKVMLSKLVTNPAQVVGWYNVAYRITVAMILVPVLASQVFFPVLAKKSENPGYGMIKFFEFFFRWMVILGIPVGIGITMLSNRIIPLVLGSGYTNSVIALQILIWSTILIYLHAPFERVLEADGYQMLVTKTMGICAGINIGLNFVLIPTHSYVGAAIATVLTELSVLLITYTYYSRSGFKFKLSNLKIFPKAILGGICIAVFLFCFSNVSLWILIPVSASIYFAITYLVGGVTDRDLDYIRKLIR